MIRYTTPTITLIVEGVDLTDQDVRVTLAQGNVELTKKGPDLTLEKITHDQVTDTSISLMLSQTESAAFEMYEGCSLQVNWITSGGFRQATEIKTVPVMRNLLDEVISYGD